MTMTQEATHTAECVELLGITPEAYRNAAVPTVERMTNTQLEIIYACPHWAHDIPRQLAHR